MQIKICNCNECYYNNNLEALCLHDKITVGPTGICESMMHCDDYICSHCERFDVCAKTKKEEFLQGENTNGVR